MDMTTVLIIVVVILLLGGGAWLRPWTLVLGANSQRAALRVMRDALSQPSLGTGRCVPSGLVTGSHNQVDGAIRSPL
jgi:hypothetical protein